MRLQDRSHDTKDSYLGEISAAASGIDVATIEHAVDILEAAYRDKQVVVGIGNGGSASTAQHFVSDLGKYATWPRTGFRALDLVSNMAASTAWTNDEGWDDAYVHALSPWLETDGVVVAFSVHGGNRWSSNLVRALAAAREAGMRTIGLAGNGGGEFVGLCDVCVVVPTPANHLITPVTEAMHVVVHHMIVAMLQDRISRV